QQVEREVEHVGAPAVARTEPFTKRLGKRRQVQEEVLGLDELGRLAVDLRDGVDEVDCIELVAALVALVSASAVVAADRTRALDVAVGERAARGRGDRTRSGLSENVAV